MKWSWKLATVKGIAVYVHVTFLILLAWVLLSHVLTGSSVASAVRGLVWILAIFSCVVLHEFGHALAARRYGILTKDITLLPIGGVARLERMPDKPWQELIVALAGPAVNLVIAAGLALYLSITANVVPLEQLGMLTGPFAERLVAVNLFLLIFNLIPAFPMDGGRVLRALLAMKLSYVRATNIAAGVGQGLAFLFGFIGLFSNPFLLFIALFVWIGAAQEDSFVEVKHALSGMPVARGMITDYQALNGYDPLARAVERVIAGFQEDFPVVDGGRVIGMLTRSGLLTGLKQFGENTAVSRVMETDFLTARPDENLEDAFSRLQASAARSIPVVTAMNQLVGLITVENIAELLMIRQALDGGPLSNQPETPSDSAVALQAARR